MSANKHRGVVARRSSGGARHPIHRLSPGQAIPNLGNRQPTTPGSLPPPPDVLTPPDQLRTEATLAQLAVEIARANTPRLPEEGMHTE